MIEQIRIENFQSIEKLDLVCGPITVIYGESDTGKSAIVRALYGLAFNSYPKGHVRDGAAFSYVSVASDIVVSAEKGPGVNRYRLVHHDRGQSAEWDRVGTEVPAEVSAVLGWRSLELDDGSRFTPGFGLQFDPPFLLTDSPSRRAKVLGSLTNVATLYAAIKEANSWERRSKNRADAQREIIERTGSRVPDLERRLFYEQKALAAVQQDVSKAREMQSRVTAYEGVQKQLNELRTAVDVCEGLLAVLASSDPSAELAEAERLIPKVQGLEAMWNNIEAAQLEIARESVAYDEHDKKLIEIEMQLEEFDVCPLCGHSLEKEGHEHE